MNEPNQNPAATNPSTTASPWDHRYELRSMEVSPDPLSVVEALLKRPGRILFELCGRRSGRVMLALLVPTTLGLLIYGLVAGSLTGGDQLWIAPAKIVVGSAAAALICLPSLYIFLCLSGAEVGSKTVAGMLSAAVCLTALLLVGFAPVAWVFSQSTDSVAFMGALHLVFWLVAVVFGMKLLGDAGRCVWGGGSGGLGVWMIIYVVVSLQMMTALRPIIGHGNTLLPTEKRFFVTHWVQTLGGVQ